jgi:hypothetical protein
VHKRQLQRQPYGVDEVADAGRNETLDVKVHPRHATLERP